MAKKPSLPRDGSSLGEYTRVIGELDGENEKVSEDPAKDQCEGKEDRHQPPDKEPSSEGETS